MKMRKLPEKNILLSISSESAQKLACDQNSKKSNRSEIFIHYNFEDTEASFG